jgi:dTDP-4-dehydrorhamnose 3,5-epimerase
MDFISTPLRGAFVLELEKHVDQRGFFARTFCADEFQGRGLNARVVQCSLSFNRRRGTLRGMHYQAAPVAEAKLVRCIAGAIYDVIVDIRAESPTYLQHFAVELSAANRRGLYIPEGFAHGFQALTDGAELLYQISEFYAPGYDQGLRYDDPALAIQWPLVVTAISERDASWPLLGSDLGADGGGDGRPVAHRHEW